MKHADGVAFDAETRHSVMRVWLAISAVWIGFWLLIAGLGFATSLITLADNLIVGLVILFAPPLAVLGLATLVILVLDNREPRVRNC